jgi:hypothetical protein
MVKPPNKFQHIPTSKFCANSPALASMAVFNELNWSRLPRFDLIWWTVTVV